MGISSLSAPKGHNLLRPRERHARAPASGECEPLEAHQEDRGEANHHHNSITLTSIPAILRLRLRTHRTRSQQIYLSRGQLAHRQNSNPTLAADLYCRAGFGSSKSLKPHKAQSCTSSTSRKRGPWTPLMRVISMSAVADGPEKNVTGRVGSRRAKASGKVSTTCAASTTQR